MTYTVTDPCVNAANGLRSGLSRRAFHLVDEPDRKLLVINPETCIDCDACVPECPVEAIFPEDKVPEDQQHWTPLNAELCIGNPIQTEKMEAVC